MDEKPEVLGEDPTILEYLKKKLRGQAVSSIADHVEVPQADPQVKPLGSRPVFFFLSLAAVLLGQLLLEFLRQGLMAAAIVLFLVGAGLLFFAKRRNELEGEAIFRESPKVDFADEAKSFPFRWYWFLVAVIFAFGAFLSYKNGDFNPRSGVFWVLSVLFTFFTFWKKQPQSLLESTKNWLRVVTADKVSLLLGCLVIGIVIYFQFVKIPAVPGEMISTQVESFLSVHEILKGNWALWFPRNLVSEPFGYYWAAAFGGFFADGFSYTALKTAYALSGLVGVIYTFKLGKLVFDRQTGWIAALLVGTGYWALIPQRAVVGYGLVLGLLAPALFYLFKSLEEESLNSLLWCALFTSLGMMTNKVFLILPVLGLLISVLWKAGKSRDNPGLPLILRVGLSLAAGVIFLLPLIFIVLSNFSTWIAPVANGLNRGSSAAEGARLFLKNLLSGIGIVNWSNQSSWVDGIPQRSGLDWLSAGFFLFGVFLLLLNPKKSDRKKVWTAVLLFIGFLVLPALNIAFPNENPSIGKHLPVLFLAALLAARAISFVWRQLLNLNFKADKIWRAVLAAAVGLILLVSNHNLLIQKYGSQFTASAWNAGEMAFVLDHYDQGVQNQSRGYVVGYPHWVDGRAVAILKNAPDENLSILPAELEDTVSQSDPKIFLLHPFDKDSIAKLKTIYPQGLLSTYQSVNPDKNFVIYIVGQ